MNAEDHIINENQRRAITTTLALLDEMLCVLEQWGKGREAHSVLYEEQNLLSQNQRRNLLHEISRMRKILAGLQECLCLPRQVRSATGDIWSRCAALRESLMELEGDRLKGYGALHPNLKRVLEEAIPPLLQGLDRLGSVASRREPHGPRSK